MGGGQGAVAINDAISANASKLVKTGADIVLLAGRGREVNIPKSVGKHVQVLEFTSQVTAYEQAADVVVTRAGATTMAELQRLAWRLSLCHHRIWRATTKPKMLRFTKKLVQRLY